NRCLKGIFAKPNRAAANFSCTAISKVYGKTISASIQRRRTYGFSQRKPVAHGAEHVTMAIYSFNHDSFGKTTNRAGAAGDNAAYNARDNDTRLANDNTQGNSD